MRKMCSLILLALGETLKGKTCEAFVITGEVSLLQCLYGETLMALFSQLQSQSDTLLQYQS